MLKIYIYSYTVCALGSFYLARCATAEKRLRNTALRDLCKACGVEGKGSSKMDLVLKIREKMSNRVTYNKVFQKVWGASGKSKKKFSIYMKYCICLHTRAHTV